MKIEKLELRHLVGYLPYGLKFLSPKHRLKFGEQIILTSRGMSLCDDGSLNIEFLYDDDLIFSNEMKTCKLILRPLSDLTKEIEVNGEKFVPILEILKANGKPNRKIERCSFDGSFIYEYEYHYGQPNNESLQISVTVSYPICNVRTYEWLLKHHFDIHGLIESGLAIDINTI